MPVIQTFALRYATPRLTRLAGRPDRVLDEGSHGGVMGVDQSPFNASAEHERLEQAKRGEPWKRWGPYLSERQWGTVREDYSEDGNAWHALQPRPVAVESLRLGRRRHSPASPTTASSSVSRSRSGTARTRSSRSASSA